MTQSVRQLSHQPHLDNTPQLSADDYHRGAAPGKRRRVARLLGSPGRVPGSKHLVISDHRARVSL